MEWYWNEMVNHLGDGAFQSIQIKWFYNASAYGNNSDGDKHVIIWEGNRNKNEQWYTYAPFETVSPPNGNYRINCYSSGGKCVRYLECSTGQWFNTHCKDHFAPDACGTQHFVEENSK